MPRKTSSSSWLRSPAGPASMRPRPDAAENGRCPVLRTERRLASMRPRPDAAENALISATASPGTRPASMRPRPDAAENAVSLWPPAPPPRCRFNEAAARCRGKRGRETCHQRSFLHWASMRPRPDAAENAAGPRLDRSGRDGFNEAAARCRGKRGSWSSGPAARRTRRFNEAAARCRGKRGAGEHRRPASAAASMRPRPDAAENTRSMSAWRSQSASFNEAAARCRGKRSFAASVDPVRFSLQ